jgi:hypothetical protein
MVSMQSPRRGSGSYIKIGLLVALIAVMIISWVAYPRLESVDAQLLQLSSLASSSSASSDTAEKLKGSHDGSSSLTATSEVATGVARYLQKPAVDFFEMGLKTGTDKIGGSMYAKQCKEGKNDCSYYEERKNEFKNPNCQVRGHFYDTMYNRWFAPYTGPDVEPFQALEIGFYNGNGYDAYSAFLPKAEFHSCEISCIADNPKASPRNWHWGNFASKNKKYQSLLQRNLLHCYDAANMKDLLKLWQDMRGRPDAPPLKIVIDDGAHISDQMALSIFFWFPRIEPGGLLVMEDIQPIPEATEFRLYLLPQLLHDMHYCGTKTEEVCFPTIQPLLKSIHCEMHICVLERNDQPAVLLDETASMPPPHALQRNAECLYH